MSTSSDDSGNDGPVSELLQNETVCDVVTKAIREYHQATVGLAASLEQLRRRSEEQRERIWDAIDELRHEAPNSRDASQQGESRPGQSGADHEFGERQNSSKGLRGTNDDPIDFGPLKLTGEFSELSEVQLPPDDASIYLLVDYYPPLALEIFRDGQAAVVRGYVQSVTYFSKAMGLIADGALEFSMAKPDWGTQQASDDLYFVVEDSAESVNISGQEHQILGILRTRSDS